MSPAEAAPVVQGTALSPAAHVYPPLRIIAEHLRDVYGCTGSIAQTVAAAEASQLAAAIADTTGLTLMERARLCYDRVSPPDEDATLPPEPVIGMPLAPSLTCLGVSWSFHYFNLYGDWHLSAATPLCNGRPHYEHQTMYAGRAHLFHANDAQHDGAPRWLIGPSTDGAVAWAFAESDAPTVESIDGSDPAGTMAREPPLEWIAWDGAEWCDSGRLRFTSRALTAAERAEERELESRFVGADGYALLAADMPEEDYEAAEEAADRTSATASEAHATRGAAGTMRARWRRRALPSPRLLGAATLKRRRPNSSDREAPSATLPRDPAFDRGAPRERLPRDPVYGASAREIDGTSAGMMDARVADQASAVGDDTEEDGAREGALDGAREGALDGAREGALDGAREEDVTAFLRFLDGGSSDDDEGGATSDEGGATSDEGGAPSDEGGATSDKGGVQAAECSLEAPSTAAPTAETPDLVGANAAMVPVMMAATSGVVAAPSGVVIGAGEKAARAPSVEVLQLALPHALPPSSATVLPCEVRAPASGSDDVSAEAATTTGYFGAAAEIATQPPLAALAMEGAAGPDATFSRGRRSWPIAWQRRLLLLSVAVALLSAIVAWHTSGLVADTDAHRSWHARFPWLFVLAPPPPPPPYPSVWRAVVDATRQLLRRGPLVAR